MILWELFLNQGQKNKVIILNSCHSGFAGNMTEMQNFPLLMSGTTILAACNEKQYSSQKWAKDIYIAADRSSLRWCNEFAWRSISR